MRTREKQRQIKKLSQELKRLKEKKIKVSEQESHWLKLSEISQKLILAVHGK